MTDQNSNDNKPKVVVVVVPLPIQGHLNQLLHLSHLIISYGIPVHYAGSSSHNRQARHRIHGWGLENLNNIHFHDFQLPSYESSLPLSDPSVPFPAHFVPFLEASTNIRQPVTQLLQELSTKFTRVVVIHDNSMAYVVQDVKLISNAESYCFIPICAFTYFFMVWEGLPQEAKPFELDSKDKDIPNSIPSQEGCATQEMVDFILKQLKFLGFESGYIYNTSRVIDGRYVESMEKLSGTKSQKKHFAIGPFNPVDVIIPENQETRHQCLQWLDEQEKGSVIYVSFGSTTSLTDDQIEELAKGLERSREKFIWVLRRADPNDVFAEGDKVRKPQLPEGYEERVKGRGLIVKEWAPQLEILAHSSTGGFMSHCGWNSCMESISMGVPILAWPMHSDQPKNAYFVSEVLRTGMWVRKWEHRGQLVKSSDIDNVVKSLTTTEDGKDIKKRAAKLGEAVRGSVAQGGVTCAERGSFIAHISR